MTDPKQLSPARRRLYIALALGTWLAFFAWCYIPPYRGNVLEMKRDFLVWHWQLYSRGGEGICDVRYFDMNQGGEAIERWTLLGYERPGKMPDNLARTKKKQLYTEYRRVCSALRKQGDRAPNVEVSARCAVKGEWKPVENRRRNVCTVKHKPKTKRPRVNAARGAR